MLCRALQRGYGWTDMEQRRRPGVVAQGPALRRPGTDGRAVADGRAVSGCQDAECRRAELRQPASHSATAFCHRTGRGARHVEREDGRLAADGRGGPGRAGAVRAELQQAEQAAQQIRIILTASQEGLGADAVFWHPGATGDAPEGVGASELSPAWRQEFMDSRVHWPKRGAAPARCCGRSSTPRPGRRRRGRSAPRWCASAGRAATGWSP